MNLFLTKLRVIACTGSVISSPTVWLVVTATAVFVWALSSVLQDSSAQDIQAQQASILCFMTAITLTCAIAVGVEALVIWRDRVNLQRQHKLHLHIRLLYSVFAIGISMMELYWMIFKIIFRNCDDVVHVNYKLTSGNALFVLQISYAAVNVIFPPIMATWLTLHHRFNAPKPAAAIYFLILLTLLTKTLFVYLDEAQVMIGHATHHRCSNATKHSTGHYLNCSSLEKLDNLNAYQTLYTYHIEVLEPLEYAVCCEGLTTFLAVVFLFKKIFYDDDADDHKHAAQIEWRNLWNVAATVSKFDKFVLSCAVIVGTCLPIGLLVQFIYLFGDKGYVNQRNNWKNYLVTRCSMFALVTTFTVYACAKSAKNRRPENQRIIPSEQFDIKLLFYSMVMGPIPFFLCTLYATIVPWDKHHACYLDNILDIPQFFDTSMNFLQVISQYIFMTSAIEFKTYEKRSPDQTFAVEVAAIIMMASCQLVMWMINTGSKHIIAKINITGRDYYPASFWALAMALMYPSGVFFRAHGLVLCGTLLYDYIRSICSTYEDLEDNAGNSDILPVPRDFYITGNPVNRPPNSADAMTT